MKSNTKAILAKAKKKLRDLNTEMFSEAIKKIMIANKALSYDEAFNQAQKENPELASRYLAGISQAPSQGKTNAKLNARDALSEADRILRESNPSIPAAAEKLSKATQKLMAANPAMTYAEAFSQVQKENPALSAEYLADLKATKIDSPK